MWLGEVGDGGRLVASRHRSAATSNLSRSGVDLAAIGIGAAFGV
jgi:hypothetical protein